MTKPDGMSQPETQSETQPENPANTAPAQVTRRGIFALAGAGALTSYFTLHIR